MISQLGQLSKHFNNSLEILLKHFKKCWTILTIVWNISNFLQNIVNIFVIFSIIVHNISNNSRNISKQCCKQCKNVRNISNSVCNNLRMFWLFFFTFLAQWVLKTSKSRVFGHCHVGIPKRLKSSCTRSCAGTHWLQSPKKACPSYWGQRVCPKMTH